VSQFKRVSHNGRIGDPKAHSKRLQAALHRHIPVPSLYQPAARQTDVFQLRFSGQVLMDASRCLLDQSSLSCIPLHMNNVNACRSSPSHRQHHMVWTAVRKTRKWGQLITTNAKCAYSCIPFSSLMHTLQLIDPRPRRHQTQSCRHQSYPGILVVEGRHRSMCCTGPGAAGACNSTEAWNRRNTHFIHTALHLQLRRNPDADEHLHAKAQRASRYPWSLSRPLCSHHKLGKGGNITSKHRRRPSEQLVRVG